MNVITQPTVRLVSKQHIDNDELDGFLDAHNVPDWETDSDEPGDVIPEIAGRLCYMSFASPRPGGNAAYLSHIKDAGHGSVLEHTVFGFIFTGVSRSLTHELVRHRAGWSYSQLSQRYVDESVAEYVCPDIIAADPELHAIWQNAVAHTHEAYVRLAEKLNEKFNPRTCERCWGEGDVRFSCTGKGCDNGIVYSPFVPNNATSTDRRKAARQAARSVLPNATETKIFATANARAIRHFLEQRGSAAAEPEIRKLANALLQVVRVEAPNLFGDYKWQPLPDGTFEITTPTPKV